jgi:hypothetical protein
MKWIFEGSVYSSLEELSGKTMSKENKPLPVFSEFEVLSYAIYYYNILDKKFALTPFDCFKKNDVGEGTESESEL